MTMADAMTGEGTSYADLGYAVSLSEEEYVVGFRKDSDATDALNAYFAQWAQEGTLDEIAEKYDNAVSIAVKNEEDAASEDGESPDGESPDGESPEGESDDSENPDNKPESEAPPMGPDGIPLKPGE